MPGRILSFVKPETSPESARRNSSDSADSASSKAKRPQTLGGPMEHLKRTGLGPRKSSSEKVEKEHKKPTGGKAPPQPPKPKTKLELLWESPPNIFYGSSDSSTGALFSGQLRMTVVDPEITLDTFTMRLVAQVTSKKPVVKDCQDCAVNTKELNKWEFVVEPKKLSAGVHEFPFSYLLPGHLPTTTHGRLGVLEYHLLAAAKTKEHPAETIALNFHLPISRAVQPQHEKNHIRVFPPTNLTANCTFNPIVHPIGDFSVNLRINGIVEKGDTQQTRWRLRKFNWKLEEREKMISPACPKHAAKLGGEGKGMLHEDTRALGNAELQDGWKTDLVDGVIETEFTVRPSAAPRPQCDVKSPTGLEITHALVVELVVVEEIAPNKRPAAASPTGAARVLRMVFGVQVTERAGMGVAWDEEQPPMYEDVPPSPPMYAQGTAPSAPRVIMGHIEDYTGPPLEPPDSELEALHLEATGSAGESSAAAAARSRYRLSAEDFQ